MRILFVPSVVLVLVAVGVIAIFYPPILWSLLLLGPLALLGLRDYYLATNGVIRNFPIVGHGRFMIEELHVLIQQYFIEGSTEGMPFSRDQRSLVYQRAAGERDTVPFGTQQDVYEIGYEWINHSLAPLHLEMLDLRVTVGGPACSQPYSASLLNISAMSYGSLSKNAVLALSRGARLGDFAHNTGEGGISPYHLEGGADLIWQIGTGYFGCRSPNGDFDPEAYATLARHPNVKMIELKLSQGAKPGHGGILPAAKLTPEIAAIRGVSLGEDVLSPPAHSAFSTPVELLEFVARLRDLCGGKPVGFKLCVGKRREFLAICKAMVATGITPDFIAVDGGEGGTGAAPLEFANHMGAPLVEGLIFVHNALVGVGLRDRLRVIASGKVTSGFEMVKRLALGADMCNSARGMMLALGCIQALKCNTNRCPVGVTSQDPQLVRGLVPEDKAVKVASFHHELLKSVGELMGAMGIEHPDALKPWHLLRRTGPNTVEHYGEIYEFLNDGELLRDPLPASFERAFLAASADKFHHHTPAADGSGSASAHHGSL